MKDLSFPLLTSIQLTDSCNCDCRYCYNLKRTNRYMQKKDFDLILESLERGNIFHIVLEGGEPFLHKHLLYFCKRIKEKNIDYTIITNATLITKAISERLKDLDCNIIVSIDSINPEIHNSSRDNWDLVIKGIRELLVARVPIGINTVINRYNIDTLTEIVDFFYPQIKRFSFLKLIHRSIDDNVIDDLQSYSKKQFDQLGKRIGLIKKKNPDIKILSPFNFPNRDNLLFQESFDMPGCLAGTTYVTIKPNLDVIPCSYAQKLVVGNLRDTTIKSLWENSMLNNLKCSNTLPCSININS